MAARHRNGTTAERLSLSWKTAAKHLLEEPVHSPKALLSQYCQRLNVPSVHQELLNLCQIRKDYQQRPLMMSGRSVSLFDMQYASSKLHNRTLRTFYLSFTNKSPFSPQNAKRPAWCFIIEKTNHSTVTYFRCLAAMSPEGNMRAGIRLGYSWDAQTYTGKVEMVRTIDLPNLLSFEFWFRHSVCTAWFVVIFCFVMTIVIIIITDSMWSVFSTDASLSYTHGLSEKLIIKEGIKVDRGLSAGLLQSFRIAYVSKHSFSQSG
ncbi:hypothetical protein T265_15514, partial [Opisthorchis viverrini]